MSLMPMISQRTTNASLAFDFITRNQAKGYVVHSVHHHWEWWTWRYVKIYSVTMTLPESKTLEFRWGPVCERPLPPDPHGT